jgi:Protein of unknown function (DUF402)
MTERWQPGERITLRYVGHSHLGEAGKPGLLQGWPYVVVEDSEDWLALWMPAGTRMKRLDLADRARPVADLVHGEHPTEFRRGEQLRLMHPDRHTSVWLHWSNDAERAFLGYYVNIEAPYIRTPIGVDTTDLSLDLVVWPDLSWEWKDEHLEKPFEDLGIFTPEESRRIRVHGEEVIAAVEARRPPFDGSWLDWRPPADWAVPEVHDGWEFHPDVSFPLFTRRRLTGLDPAFEGQAPR